MGIFGVIWIVLIVLKLLGVALVTTSWLLVLFWPLIPIVVLFLIGSALGVGFTLFGVRKKSY